ncbi:MAG: transglutaminase-like cysteine peptidase [Sphingomicrobium sp.]
MKRLALTLLALAGTSAPAAAQVAPAYISVNKTDAILGGAPSALAAILAKQSGAAAPVATAAFTVPTAAPSPESRGPVFRSAELPIAHAPVSLDRPDVFNTVALAITHTSLDRRWNQVSHGAIGARASAYSASVADRSPLDRLDAVNRFVNSRVTFVNDIQQFGVSDRWTTGADTLRRGRGDCEDFAIAKLQMLRHAGFSDKDLYLVILRDVSRRADHAVLVVRAEGRMLVLDNGTSRIVDSEMIADYRPIFTFSGNNVWTHGYRRAVPAVELASIDKPVRSAMVEMASIDTAVAPAALSN